jgi:hypothetical protein
VHANAEGRFTAAQWAMRRGNPGAVGTMLIAIQECGLSTQEKVGLKARLGVETQAVLYALRQLNHPQDKVWAEPMIRRLVDGGKAMGLLRGERLVVARGADKTLARRCRDAHLRAEKIRLVSQAGVERVMLDCTSREKIDHLSAQVSLADEDRPWRYLIAADDLAAAKGRPSLRLDFGL